MARPPEPPAPGPSRGPRPWGIAALLVAVLVAVLGAAVLLVGLVTYRTERAAIRDAVAHLRAGARERVRSHLDEYLEVPRKVNALAEGAARIGLLDLGDPDAVTRWFWAEGSAFPGIGTMAWANLDGEFYGANVPERYVVVADRRLTGGAIRRYAPAADGARTGVVLSEHPGYDARRRAWFQAALAAGRPGWAGISVSVTTRRLDLTEAAPLLDSAGAARGVFLVDLSLARVGEFLRGVLPAGEGTVFIAGRDGLLVASAGEGPPFRLGPGPEARPERIAAAESPDPLVAAAARALRGLETGGDTPVSGEFSLAGRRYFLEATPYRRDPGIDWNLAVVIPEAALAAPFEAGSRAERLAVIAALALAAAAGAFTARRLAEPIRRLNASARALAEGDWDAPLPGGRVAEVRELASSFAEMRARLRGLVERLEREVAERRRAEEARAASEQQYRELFEESRDGVFLSSPSGRLLEINPAGVAILGFSSRDEALARFSPDNVWARPGDRERMLAALRGAGFVTDFETAFVRADGGEIAVSIGATAVREPGGELGAIRGIFRDVTEHRRLEEQLRHAQKMEAVGRLAGGIAHDFNNILTAVAGSAQLLERLLDPGDPRRAHAAGILDAVDRASALTRSLLAFGRRQAMDRRPVQLNAIVGGVAPLLARLVPETVRITTSLAAEDTTVVADTGQVEQVLMNLVTNAADAMPAGGELRIATAGAGWRSPAGREGDPVAAGRYATLTVADTGDGMDAETLERIFEPFFTTKAAGKGTGLGLATAYGIVRQHGGQIEVESAPGRGTRFTVLLPAPAPTGAAGW